MLEDPPALPPTDTPSSHARPRESPLPEPPRPRARLGGSDRQGPSQRQWTDQCSPSRNSLDRVRRYLWLQMNRRGLSPSYLTICSKKSTWTRKRQHNMAARPAINSRELPEFAFLHMSGRRDMVLHRMSHSRTPHIAAQLAS